MNILSPYFIDLSAAEPLFFGTTRRVYAHPEQADYLIKVPSKTEEERRFNNIPVWKRRFKPAGIANIANLREIAEIMRLNPEAQPELPHIYRFIGLIATNYGWGQIVKAEKTAGGDYAPSLEQIAHQPEQYQSALAEFTRWAETAPIVLIDCEPWNCVLAERSGKPQIVLIDGIGEKNAVALRTYFPALNRRKNRQQLTQFYQSLELVKQGKSPHRRCA